MMHDHRFAAGGGMPDHGHGSVMMFVQDDDIVRSVVEMTRRGCPPRRNSRTRLRADPVPDVVIVEPAVIVRDVFFLVKDVAVLGKGCGFRARHDDRGRRGRDDLLRGRDDDRLCFHDNRLFHDHRLFNDRRRRFHDDRSRAGFHDGTHQVHDVRRKPDTVGRGFVMRFPGEGSRGEDDRGSEGRADNECLVDGLLSRVSYGERFGFSGSRKAKLILTS